MGTVASIGSREGRGIKSVTWIPVAPDNNVRSLIEAVPERLQENAPPLIRAAASGDSEETERLLLSQDGLNAPDGEGRTPLHCAAVLDEEAVLCSLLALGRSYATLELRLDAADRYGMTALHYAAVTRNAFSTRLLLAEGASAECRDLPGQTALMKAAKWDDAVVCCELLNAGAAVDAVDGFGQTALHLAAAVGSAGVVKLLLERGASADAVDGAGRTPLSCALSHSRLSAARALLPASDSQLRADDTGRTELHWAAANGSPDIVELLLRRRPATWPRDAYGMSPLLRALEARNEAAADLLLDAGDEGCVDLGAMTALHWAARAGLARLVGRLLAAGHSAWAADHMGRDALMWALASGDNETVATLLRDAGYTQRTEHFGRTALHLAAVSGNTFATLNLLQCGADTDAVDIWGRTPLACARTADVADILACHAAKKVLSQPAE